MNSTEEPIVVEERFDQPVEVVWKAITDSQKMRLWFFNNIPDFKPEKGFRTQFTIEGGGRKFIHLWQVTDVVPLKTLTYNWRYDGFPGDSNVTFEIIQQENSTHLRVSHQVLDSFPDEVPEFKREACLGGWTYFINQRLKEYLNQRDR